MIRAVENDLRGRLDFAKTSTIAYQYSAAFVLYCAKCILRVHLCAHKISERLTHLCCYVQSSSLGCALFCNSSCILGVSSEVRASIQSVHHDWAADRRVQAL